MHTANEVHGTAHTRRPSADALVDNARKFGKQSQHVASAAVLLGLCVHSLCCWCADKGAFRDMRVARLACGGECEQCPYVGEDCLVVIPDGDA